MDCQERGVSLTRYNVLTLINDFKDYEVKIRNGTLENSENTLNRRLKSVDESYANSKKLDQIANGMKISVEDTQISA